MLTIFATLLTAFALGAEGDGELSFIQPHEAPQFEGQRARMLLQVSSVNESQKALAMLNSHYDYLDKNNFCAVIPRSSLPAFKKAELPDLPAFQQVFVGHAVVVTGEVKRRTVQYKDEKGTLHSIRKYDIVVTDPADIEFQQQAQQ